MVYYNRLSVLAIAIFLVLVYLQVNWLLKAVEFQKKEINYELKVIAPEIALDVNSLDHDAFHVDRDSMNRVSQKRINKVIGTRLTEAGLNAEVLYAIYQDSSAKVYSANTKEHINELILSDAKACISCIVSFSTISEEDAHLLDGGISSISELTNSETFQYYSPITRSSNAEPELWFSLYYPSFNLGMIKSMIPLFTINILLLLSLLSLFYLLLRSLSRHKELARVKDDFFNNVTHEFKTPLSSIILATKVLRNNPNEKKRLNYIDLIENESKSLEGQIDRLLELSLVDNKEITFENSEFPLCGLLYEIPSKLLPIIEDKKAKVIVDCDISDATIKGDYYHLLNSFTCLVENSLKYSKEGVTIKIQAYVKDNVSHIEISDNGPGIAKEHQPHIFKRFYRGQKTNQYKGTGFGIGLSYVKTTIQAHNGSIVLDRSDNTGTSFLIKL